MKVFLSYSRSDASVAGAVAEDVRLMGHTVWYDREVAGGQVWWDAILRQIRECDLFVFILTPKSLESQACRAEYKYASRLPKKILPVLCHDGVKVNLLPTELSLIQYVDYRAQDKQAAYAMVRAFQDVPEADPLPDPLPPEPPVPISYLGDLRAKIESDQEFTSVEQRDLLFEIKRRLKDLESREDALDLLRLLRCREDLLASVADEIDAILDGSSRERKHKPPEAPVLTEVPGVTDSSTETIDLTGDSRGLELVVNNVVLKSEIWTLKAAKDSLFIYLENGKLILAASFHRWMGKDAERLKAMGWDLAGTGMQSSAAAALGALGAATSGLGFALLLHKGTRDYLTRNLAVKFFSISQEKEAARNIVEVFRILCPGITRAVASKVVEPPMLPQKPTSG
jgi:hypothetical protein